MGTVGKPVSEREFPSGGAEASRGHIISPSYLYTDRTQLV